MNLVGTTVLVTGATGFLGSALVQRLSNEGAHVRAMARKRERGAHISKLPNVELVLGDLTNLESLTALVSDVNTVIHAAAALGGPLEFQRKINVAGTQAIARAAADAHVARFVHVSTIAIYGYSSRGVITESHPQQPGRVPYNVSKAEAEAVVREVGEAYRLPYTIIRPGMIYGPNSTAWTLALFRHVRRRPTVWIGDGSGSCFPIYIDDVVDMTMKLMAEPSSVGHAFNCAPDPTPTWREFLGEYMRLAGKTQWIGIPIPIIRLIAPLIETLLHVRGEPQDVPNLVDFVTQQTTFSMSKAHKLLGWQPRVSLSEGIERCRPFLQAQGLL